MDTYDTVTSQSSCPAYCRLRPQGDKTSCNMEFENNLLHSVDGIVVLKSPRYECDNHYPSNLMCIYTVNMKCSSNRMVITHSNLSLAANDSIQIVDNQVHEPVTGTNAWPETQLTVNSQFRAIFWSNSDEVQGRGFQLQLECANTSPDNTEQESSGDDIDLITQV